MTSRISRGAFQAAAILAVSIALGAIFNHLGPFGISWSSNRGLTVVADSGEISLAEARSLQDKGAAVFVDARDEASFRAGHIAGALNITAESVPLNIELLSSFAIAGTTIIVYCDGLNCQLGTQLARVLRQRGITNTRVLASGLSSWAAAKYPTAAGQ